MGLIVIGDLHLKPESPFKDSINKFFNWLYNEYKDHTMLFLGDIYDMSSPHNSLRKFLIKHLLKFKEVHILTGNHDLSKRSGNALTYLSQFHNISVYEDITDITLQGLKILMLPFKSAHKEEYEQLTGEYDYIFTHITPVQCQFKDEGLEFSNLKGTFVHGHIHTQTSFIDKFNNSHHVVGVPIPTRHGEQGQDFKILDINNEGVISEISVPQYFTYETIEYGETPSNNANILNIKNAPDKKSVYEKYNKYHIRNEGITYKGLELLSEDNAVFMKDKGFLKPFLDFTKKEKIGESVITIGKKYLT